MAATGHPMLSPELFAIWNDPVSRTELIREQRLRRLREKKYDLEIIRKTNEFNTTKFNLLIGVLDFYTTHDLNKPGLAKAGKLKSVLELVKKSVLPDRKKDSKDPNFMKKLRNALARMKAKK